MLLIKSCCLVQLCFGEYLLTCANAVLLEHKEYTNSDQLLQRRQALECLHSAEVFAEELYNKVRFVPFVKTVSLFCFLLQRVADTGKTAIFQLVWSTAFFR